VVVPSGQRHGLCVHIDHLLVWVAPPDDRMPRLECSALEA
jgi:hypothetical protein